MAGQVKRGFLRVLNATLNKLTRRMARAGMGPFSLVVNVGRKSGRVFETPVILARSDDAFIAELTYGPDVQWYRNITAAGHCEVVVKGRRYHIDRIEECSTAEGLRAFGGAKAVLLRVLHRTHFRALHIGAAH
jgi:deazaflavin-dependent oxidoreductase (nitroreductase family)